jgi:hypothetical protein
MEALTGKFVTDTKRASREFERETNRMQKQAFETGRAIGASLRNGIVAVLGGVAIGAAFRNAVQQADQLGEIAERAGITAEELSRMGYAAKMSGIELEQLANANRNLGLRLEKNEELFGRLGVTTRNADGSYRRTTDLIRDLADAFQEMPEGVEQSRIAADLFGAKLGGTMIPLLNRGSEGLRQMEAEADALGITIGNETADQAGKFNDQLDRMGGIMRNLLLNALPVMNTALEAGTKAFLIFQGAVQKGGTALAAFVQLIAKYADGVAQQFARLGEMAGFYSDVFEMGPGPAFDKWRSSLTDLMNEPARQGINTVMEYMRLLGEFEQIDQRTASAIAALDGAGAGAQGTTLPDLEDEDPATATRGRPSRAAKDTKDTKDNARAEAKRRLAAAIDAEREARRRLKEEEREARRAEMMDVERMLSDAQFELDLMKMSNVEARTAIQLRGYSAEAVRRYGDELRALNEELERQRQVTQQLDGVRDAAANAFEGIISGSMSAKDAFRSFVDDILAQMTRAVANNFAQQLFGGFGQAGGGSAGGWLSGLFGSFFGGGLAGGGPVSGGTPYLVGENGPELFIPKSSGRIANNAEVRGMGRGGTTINISVEGQVDMRSRQQLAADVGRESQKALARTG